MAPTTRRRRPPRPVSPWAAPSRCTPWATVLVGWATVQVVAIPLIPGDALGPVVPRPDVVGAEESPLGQGRVGPADGLGPHLRIVQIGEVLRGLVPLEQERVVDDLPGGHLLAV